LPERVEDDEDCAMDFGVIVGFLILGPGLRAQKLGKDGQRFLSGEVTKSPENASYRVRG
jgi:hypothetical protein